MVKIEIRMRLSSIKYYQYIILLYSNIFFSLLWPSCQFVQVRPPFLYHSYYTTIVKNNFCAFWLFSEHQNLFHHNSPSLWLANEDKKRTDRLGIFTEIPPKSILSAGWVLSSWLAVGTRRKWIGWEYWREIISRIFCPQNHFSLIWL